MNDQIARRVLSQVILVLTGVISFGTVEPAMAERITFVAQGTVFLVEQPLSGTFSVGDNFTVEFTFESLTPDSNPSPNRGDYLNAITALSVTVGPYSATATGDNVITIFDNLLGSDQYRIDLTDSMVGPSVNGFDLSTQSPVLQLRDPTGTAFTTDALPTSPPNPAGFISGGTFLALEFEDPKADPWFFRPAIVSANVSSIVRVLHVTLDIKPGSCPNSFNRNSHGVLPVGLLGDEDFDITQVDVSSVVISRQGVDGSAAPNEGPAGPHSVFEDVGTPFDGELCDCHELEGDGILDLLLKFRTQEVVEALELDALPGGALVELVVSGTLLDGTPFTASDCIRIVPLKNPGGDGAVGATDLLSLLAAWGPCARPPANCPGDLDGDGLVDGTDLLILLASGG